MDPIVIGLYSPAPQSGKGTVADVLVNELCFQEIAMADPLRQMLRPLLLYYGHSPDYVEHLLYNGYGKETATNIPGLPTTRHLLQTLGTDWGRKMIHPHIWTNIAKTRIDDLQMCGEDVVVSDIRFEEEFNMIRSFPRGYMVRIVRRDNNYNGNHVSEGRLCNMPFDMEIHNRGTVEGLRDKASDLPRKLLM